MGVATSAFLIHMHEACGVVCQHHRRDNGIRRQGCKLDAQALRDRNRACFERMLEALGRKDWDVGFACMSEDVLCDWPYLPIPEMCHEMRGRDTIR